MKITSNYLLGVLIVFGTFYAGVSMNVSGQVVLNQDWETFSNGDDLTFGTTFPYGMRFGGGSTPSASNVEVVNTTVATQTSNWALVGNNATDEPTANPILAAVLRIQTTCRFPFHS